MILITLTAIEFIAEKNNGSIILNYIILLEEVLFSLMMI